MVARSRVVVRRAPRGGTARVRVELPAARELRPGAEVTVAFRTPAVEVAPFLTRLAGR